MLGLHDEYLNPWYIKQKPEPEDTCITGIVINQITASLQKNKRTITSFPLTYTELIIDKCTECMQMGKTPFSTPDVSRC